jgi:hypothetical protein
MNAEQAASIIAETIWGPGQRAGISGIPVPAF